MFYTLDENKNVVSGSIKDFELSFSNPQKRLVARTEFPNGDVLSTVFLSIDHSFDKNDGPVCFESLWFGGIYDGEIIRYKTWNDALAGHNQWIQQYIEQGK